MINAFEVEINVINVMTSTTKLNSVSWFAILQTNTSELVSDVHFELGSNYWLLMSDVG